MKLSDLKSEQEIVIPAWWRKGALTRCRVGTISEVGLFVNPLEGNPHGRWFSKADIESFDVPTDSPPAA